MKLRAGIQFALFLPFADTDNWAHIQYESPETWSAQSVELLLRHSKLSKNFEEQRRTDVTPTMKRNGHGASIAVRPAFVAPRLATLHEAERQRHPLELAGRRARSSSE